MSNSVSVELDQVAHARLLSHIATKAALAKRRSGSHNSPREEESYSPRYGKIEQQFLPKEVAARGIVPQRAHRIVVRHGQLVDVTEEEEDKMAITVVKKAEEHARERAHISPLKSPRVDAEKLLLPRSPRGSGGSVAAQHGYLPSPRGRTSQSGLPSAAPSVASDAAVPPEVIVRERKKRQEARREDKEKRREKRRKREKKRKDSTDELRKSLLTFSKGVLGCCSCCRFFQGNSRCCAGSVFGSLH